MSLPVWIDYMGVALKGVPVQEPKAPPGVVNVNNEWYYEEYANGAGVNSLGLEELAATPPPNEEERKGILDLFRR
jgi:penicillin-binding protein 1A